MGTFKDMVDVATDISKSGKDISDTAFKKKKYSSLSRKAAEGTLQFPVLVSRSLDIETAQMISKALERNFASFVQIAMTMSPSFDLESDKDLAGYVRKFHQNQGIKSSTNDIHNMLTMVDESVRENYVYSVTDEGSLVANVVCEGSTIGVRRANSEASYDVLEGVNMTKLNDKFVPVLEAKKHRPKGNVNNGWNSTHSTNSQNVQTTQQKPNGTNTGSTTTGSGPTMNNQVTRHRTGTSGGSSRPSQQTRDFNGSNQERFSLPSKVLTDNDARKANELVPTMMHTKVRAVTPNGAGRDIEFLIGIKAFLHPVKSEEMVDNILSGLRNKGKLFNFIRWTSGEIGFFKDFLFGIKQMKLDVANQSRGHSGWWVALKRRKELATINNRMQLPTGILPNATIVVTMEEVEYIKNNLGYDLLNEAVVNRLMKEYFLLGFTVVDMGAQVAHFLFDGQDYYQAVSFSGLEKGTNQGGNAMDIKDLMRLVQRV